MATVSEALTIALEHHQGGRLQAAEQIYLQILQVEPNHPDALHLLGLLACTVGKPEIGIEYVRRALELNPGNADAHYNLGTALKQQGKLDEAATCLRKALALKADYAEAHFNLGIVLWNQGNLGEAIACYRRTLALKPDYDEAHNNLGNALREQGNVDEAVACYRRALALKPDHAEMHINLGLALREQGKLEEAIDCCHRALQLKPDYAEAHNSLGVVLKEQGNLEDAVACYGRALALKPDYAAAHNNLGIAFSDQGNWNEARACYRRALALEPDFAEAHNNLGLVLGDQEKVVEAVACYRRALALKPDYADAHNNLAVALNNQGNLHEARACFRRALALKPDYAAAHWNQSILTLLSGDFERGWAEYEWRWKINRQPFQRRNFSKPLWDGLPLAGRTILLHAEQGLGDTIQFVRYLPLVKERGGTVLFECQPALIPLLGARLGTDQLIPMGAPLPPFDVQAPLLSLPGIIGTTLATIPAKIPYLHAEPGLVEYWRKELAPLGGFKIGIAWQGNPKHISDSYRSFPLTQFATLARVEGVRLVSLQKGPGTEQLQSCVRRIDNPSHMSQVSSSENESPIFDLSDRLDRDGVFLDTAAIMMNLDLVVTVDSAVAHLAGALGVPVWVPLAVTPDWRWLLEREDSPWYPTMRLFRHKRIGEWDEVFERMAVELNHRINLPRSFIQKRAT